MFFLCTHVCIFSGPWHMSLPGCVCFPSCTHRSDGVQVDMLLPDVRPPLCIRSVSFELSEILKELLSCVDTSGCLYFTALLSLYPFIFCPHFLDTVFSESTRSFHCYVFCPSCYPILHYYLSAFPPSLILL